MDSGIPERQIRPVLRLRRNADIRESASFAVYDHLELGATVATRHCQTALSVVGEKAVLLIQDASLDSGWQSDDHRALVVSASHRTELCCGHLDGCVHRHAGRGHSRVLLRISNSYLHDV